MTDPTTTLYGAGDLIPPLPKPMPDLTKSRRAVALRIAEVIDSEWPDLAFSAGWDINEATDIIEPLIPMTAAEAEAEMEAMRDESDDDDEAICEPVVNPTLQAFKDAVGCGKVPIIEAIKAATELIQSLRAECASKEAEINRVQASYISAKFNEGREVDAEPLDESY